MDKRIEDFLDRATEGLRDDVELQLDARAELASHAEEKLQELEEAGVGNEEAVQQTVKSLGEPIELAADLYEANRRRMNFRAQLRLFMRFALVPIALLSTLWASNMYTALYTLLDAFEIPHPLPHITKKLSEPSRPLLHITKKLSDEEKFFFNGDLSRPTELEREKSIWESDPTNLVYFGNYFSASAREWREDTREIPAELLETARRVDPGNALYDYLEALKIMGVRRESYKEVLNDAIRITPFKSGDSIETAELPAYEVLDRERLDRAMKLIEKALNQPLHQYHAEAMLKRRLSMIPEPERMVDLIAYISYSAERYRPPLGPLWFKRLSELVRAYGDLLIKEGNPERAASFLAGWEKMPRQIINGGSSRLIDAQIAMTLVKTGYSSAAIYQVHGFLKEAGKTAAKTDIARAPYRHWREAMGNNQDCGAIIEKHGGVLATFSIPNTGRSLAPEELGPSRRLEYAVLSEGIAALISIALLLAILGCTMVSLRWRFTKKGRAIPLLLVPDFSTFLRILSFGVILPGLVFLLITRLAPWSGHAYSVLFGLHKLIAEFGLLIMAMLILPAILGEKAVRKRCSELDIPSTPLAIRKLNPVFLVCAAILIVFWFIPAPSSEVCFCASILLAGVIAILLLAGALGGVIQCLFGRKEYGLYYGSLFRSLIPLLAGTALLLNLTSRPILFASEKEYIHTDTLYDAKSPSFVTMEGKMAKQLGKETLAALEEAESIPKDH